MPIPTFMYDLQMLLPTLGALVFTLFFGRELWEYRQKPKPEILVTLVLALLTFACAIGTFALGWVIYPQAPSWGQWLIWPGHVVAGLAFLALLLLKNGIEAWECLETETQAFAIFGFVFIVVVLCLVAITLPSI